MLLFLPSPSQGTWYLGVVPIRGYALSILLGIIIAVFMARRRWKNLGEDTNKFENIGLVSIVAGIIGARLYWVVIEWPQFFGSSGTWYHIFYIWRGGLGIWGAIIFGFGTAWLMCRYYKIPFLRLADCVAPAFLLAQGIGRLGNWWNQELYGKPTRLPWGLKIDEAHRIPGYQQYATFHPTFLYEMLWNFIGVGLLLFLEKRFKLGRGKIFALYISFYAIGRFLIEFLRIDPVHTLGGLRVNSWPTAAGAIFGLIMLFWLIKNRPGPNEKAVTKTGEIAEEDQVGETTEGLETETCDDPGAETEDDPEQAEVKIAD